jgi:uncharacterized protein (TIGR02001 family)
MRIRRMGSVCALTAALAAPAAAGVGRDNFSGQLTLTTDYVFRGVSHSREKPALQGSLYFRHDSGFFAGIWGSNVEFPLGSDSGESGKLEVDLYLGIDRELGPDWAGIATLMRYEYTRPSGGFDFSYSEAILGLRYREQLTAFMAYTEDVYGSGEPSFTMELSALYPAPFDLDLSLGLGYAHVDGRFWPSYGFWKLGVSRALARVTVSLGYFGAGTAARRIWGESADDRLVLSLTLK